MVSAAQHGRLHVLVFLHATVLASDASLDLNLCEQEQLRLAALHGHLTIVQYLVLRFRIEITAQVFDNAARQGHKDIVVWLAEHEKVLPTTILRAAVFGGNVELVRWLVEVRGCAVYREAVVHATDENCLEVLKWLHQYASAQAKEQGRSTAQNLLDYGAISLAALRCQGSMDCATWLIESVPWVDPTYSGRELRHVDKWYETILRKELGISYRRDLPTTDQYHLSDASMAQRQRIDRFVMALIRHRPQTASCIKWLPRWAVWTRSIAALERLEAMHHPSLWTRRTFRTAVVFTMDDALMTWLIRHGQESLGREHELWQDILRMVQKWATRNKLVNRWRRWSDFSSLRVAMGNTVLSSSNCRPRTYHEAPL